jgi:hypothetical protein
MRTHSKQLVGEGSTRMESTLAPGTNIACHALQYSYIYIESYAF